MSTDDFFGGGGEDRTVMRPRPGRRRGNQTQSSTVQGTPQTTSPPASAPPLDSAFSFDMPERTPPVQPLGANFATPSPAVAPAQPLPGFGQPQAAVTQAMEIAGIGGNPIVSSATSLLALAGQVRGSISHPDVEGLRARVISEIKNFDVSCRSAGVSQDAQVAARYSLCTFLDEVVLGTHGVVTVAGVLVVYSVHSTMKPGEVRSFLGSWKSCFRSQQKTINSWSLCTYCLRWDLRVNMVVVQTRVRRNSIASAVTSFKQFVI